MDLNRFIQETDNTPPTTTCSEYQEFQSLSHLAYEFSVLDRSLFPFYVLGNSDLRNEIYGFSSNTDSCSRLVRGALVPFSSMLTQFDFERVIKETTWLATSCVISEGKAEKIPKYTQIYALYLTFLPN